MSLAEMRYDPAMSRYVRERLKTAVSTTDRSLWSSRDAGAGGRSCRRCFPTQPQGDFLPVDSVRRHHPKARQEDRAGRAITRRS